MSSDNTPEIDEIGLAGCCEIDFEKLIDEHLTTMDSPKSIPDCPGEYIGVPSPQSTEASPNENTRFPHTENINNQGSGDSEVPASPSASSAEMWPSSQHYTAVHGNGWESTSNFNYEGIHFAYPSPIKNGTGTGSTQGQTSNSCTFVSSVNEAGANEGPRYPLPTENTNNQDSDFQVVPSSSSASPSPSLSPKKQPTLTKKGFPRDEKLEAKLQRERVEKKVATIVKNCKELKSDGCEICFKAQYEGCRIIIQDSVGKMFKFLPDGDRGRKIKSARKSKAITTTASKPSLISSSTTTSEEGGQQVCHECKNSDAGIPTLNCRGRCGTCPKRAHSYCNGGYLDVYLCYDCLLVQYNKVSHV